MSVVDQVFFMLLDLLDSGFELVMPVVMAVFTATLGSAMIRIAFAWFAGSSENLMGGVIMLAIIFFTFFAIAFAAKGITDGAGRFALQLGSGIVGADTMNPDDFGPSALWSIGDDQARLILETKNALCTTTWECMKTFPEQLMLEFAALCIYAAFAFLLFEMAMTILSYKINSLFMLLFTPMAVLPFTKSFSEGAIQGTVNNLVKLTIVAMVAGVASQAFDLMDMPEEPVFDDIIPAMLLAIFVAFLAWQSRVLASGIISAVPQLSGQAITSAVGNSMRAVATGAGAATSAAMLGNREKYTMGAAAAEFASGMKRAPARISNAAAAVQNGAASAQSYWQNVRSANSNVGAATASASASGGGRAGPRAGATSGGSPAGNSHSPNASPSRQKIGSASAYQSVVGQAQANMQASEAKYAQMAADPKIGNSTAQSLRALSNETAALDTAKKLEKIDPVVAQAMYDQADAVSRRVNRAIAKGRPADVINQKSADEYRDIVLQAP